MFQQIRTFLQSVSVDPSPWGRAMGYGVIGVASVLMGVLGLLAILAAIVMLPLLIVGIPVGFVACRTLNGESQSQSAAASPARSRLWQATLSR